MDLKKIKQLLSLMESHHLAEIEIADADGGRVRLRKDSAGLLDAVPKAPAAPVFIAAPSPVQAPAPGPAAPAAAAKDLIEIKSPMVGTFYRAAVPEAEPLVNEGDMVTEDTVVCIIEAMKVMNEIKAQVQGEVVSILVENTEPVEYGQPLMLVKPSKVEA